MISKILYMLYIISSFFHYYIYSLFYSAADIDKNFINSGHKRFLIYSLKLLHTSALNSKLTIPSTKDIEFDLNHLTITTSKTAHQIRA